MKLYLYNQILDTWVEQEFNNIEEYWMWHDNGNNEYKAYNINGDVIYRLAIMR